MDSKHGKLTIALRKTAIGAAFLVVVVLALLWLAGAFHKKIGPAVQGTPITSLSGRPVGGARLVFVRKIQVPRVESSV